MTIVVGMLCILFVWAFLDTHFLFGSGEYENVSSISLTTCENIGVTELMAGEEYPLPSFLRSSGMVTLEKCPPQLIPMVPSWYQLSKRIQNSYPRSSKISLWKVNQKSNSKSALANGQQDFFLANVESSSQSSSSSLVFESLFVDASDPKRTRLYPVSRPAKDPSSIHHIDILVPCKNVDDKVVGLMGRLLSSIESVDGVRFRVLLTRYTDEATHNADLLARLNDLRTRRMSESSIQKLEEIQMVLVNETAFARGRALNRLHQTSCPEEDNCTVVGMDVDMDITGEYWANVLRLVVPQETAYFPVVWNSYDPESYRQKGHENKGIGNLNLNHNYETGFFRATGFGMYALSGVDAHRYQFNTRQKGWGGEDVKFKELIEKHLTVIRKNENGLSHIWHDKAKSCADVGSQSFKAKCLATKSISDGSAFWKFRQFHNDHFITKG